MVDDFFDDGEFTEPNPYDIIKDLYKTDNIEFITDLTTEEIHSIATVLFLSKYLKVPEFEDLLKNIMKLKVSKDRKGRAEFTNIFGTIKSEQDIKKEAENKLVKG